MRSWYALAAASVALSLITTSAPTPAAAEEGMWTFDGFPSAKVKAAYGFAPDAAWLDRVQKTAVRLSVGCSGSVVSKDGLVLTNHHCVTDCEAALSSPGRDLAASGYQAAGRREERICPGLEASILLSIKDVTPRIKAAIADAPPAEIAARRAAINATVEAEACAENSERICEVVSLYRGGEYKLYIYQRYADVRLVFAPETQAAFFGGDPDNFNFPRYAFDMALVRLYRKGAPAKFTAPLALAGEAPKEGDLVFVPGHPSGTDRLMTVAQLGFDRDHELPSLIEYYAQLRGSLLTMATKGDEEARQAGGALEGVENAVKVLKGERGALVEPEFFAAKVAEEKLLRDALATRSDLRAKYGDPFAEIERMTPALERRWMAMQMLETRMGAGSILLADARRLVRAAAERAKPANERLPEFAPTRMGQIEHSLMAIAPVNSALEQLEIEFWLLKAREYLGADHPAIRAAFGARSAADIARDVVENSRLDDPAYRERLFDDPAETTASNDPAIALFRRIDPYAREARARYEAEVVGPLAAASERIAGLRFDVQGDQVYPDATFTLRLSYGVVKGWQDPVAGPVPAYTQVRGLWERATGAYPFNLAPKWLAAKGQLPPGMIMNMATTNDVIGGNSGSPLLDRQGRVAGLVFDGNIHSLGGNYGFDPQLNRTIAVASPMLVEGLRKVYGADALADELQGR